MPGGGCNQPRAAPSGRCVKSDVAKSLLVKLRRFIEDDLESDERALFGVLVAPAIAHAFGADDVEGFGMVGWSPDALPNALIAALRDGWWSEGRG